MQPLLSISDLSVDFVAESGKVEALKNISFQVSRGEVLALVGESGSGKSVTSLSILQLLPSPPALYKSGQILFSENGDDSIDLLKRAQHHMQDIRGNKIAMIFQEPMTSLNPVMSCGYQVMEAIMLHKRISRDEAKQKTIYWFNKVQLPSPELAFERYPHQLSGGQKQRVMIAMAMCCEPSLLICDEPTTALDVTVQKTILRLIRGLQEQSNMGVIFITHDLGVVAEIADRAVVMLKGEIVEQGAVKQIFTQPQHEYTKALIACRPVNHPRGERLPVVSDFLNETGTNPCAGNAGKKEPLKEFEKPEDKIAEKPNSAFHDKLIEINELSVRFPIKRNFLGVPRDYINAVDNVTFDVFKGETLGLVGESGCGKTTLGRAMLRLIDPSSGSIVYNGVDLTARKKENLQKLRKEIQIVFQDPYSSLNPRLTIGAALAEPLKVHGILATEKARREKVTELLEKVNLKAEHFNRYPHEFSGGQRQRIVIARALTLSPSFIVCDESVSALDVSVQAQVLNLLNDLKKEYGFTIIFISHDLSVVRYISDRILVMNKGRIEESGQADDIYFRPQKEYTKILLDSIPKAL
ncbi:MAG TPA: ABC transporter ATP-binding protein [Chitinophagaceae bacterium]|nr:ABC transporter ATP-binding protein [Chitinophagaceae bacterium]